MKEEEISKGEEKEIAKKANLVTFAYELGVSICVPLVIFVGIGVWIDKSFATKPLFIITGLILSLVSTSIAINKKVKKFNT